MFWLCWIFHSYSDWVSVWQAPGGGHIFTAHADSNFQGYQGFLYYSRTCQRCDLEERTENYIETKGWGI